MVEPSVFKSGFVTIVGRPNVGKSTLLNRYLGQKVAAVSPRPQTTRRRQLGILTRPDVQVIFIDTPGVHKPQHKLGDFMNQEALSTLEDADVIVFLVDASEPPTEEDHSLARSLAGVHIWRKVILALNKVDQVPLEALDDRQKVFQNLLPKTPAIQVAAVSGLNCDQLLEMLIERLPEGQPFYDEEQITDLYEREIAADLIREAVLSRLRDEVPHCVAVRIDEYKERQETGAYIAATLFVERDSQKGILIGQGGSMLKSIGTAARREIETMSDRKVYLELRVKVSKNWRNDPDALRLFGYERRSEE